MRWLGIVLVAACGAKAPPKVENAQFTAPAPNNLTYRPLTIAMRRPAIDLTVVMPEFHEELRWPLSGMNHPALVPRFAVAAELAVPGVEWEELCARGVQNRTSGAQKELLAYLRGWCAVQKRDIDAACAHLRPLLGSVMAGMTAAVRQDLANILVEQGDSEKAEHWLSKHDIRDMRTLDLLAANYIEVGSQADAFAINRRAMDSDDHATPATKCYRLVRRIVIGLDVEPMLAVEALKELGLKAEIPDPICKRLWNKILCWQDHDRCAEYFNDENVDARERLLVDAYYAWPSGAVSAAEWLTYADKAELAIPVPGASELVVSALETAMRIIGDCQTGHAADINSTIATVRADPNSAMYEARLQKLEHDCPRPPQWMPSTLPGAVAVPPPESTSPPNSVTNGKLPTVP
ncbi:MAG TPA: hypothetical protein VFV99_03550 [Kofleriaceae bacterium]|nr:hypothetical protein [Kofleriaceae bacterium]